VVSNALEYLHLNAPVSCSSRLSGDEEFVAKIRTTHLALVENSIPFFHTLEKTSSDEHVESLAENLLEAMRGVPEVAEKIEEVRQPTKREKKRLVMALQENQLKVCLGYLHHLQSSLPARRS